MDEIVVVEPAQRELATLFEERYVELAFPENISFDDAVERVKAAKRLKQNVIGDVHASYRAYIAELSTCHAVEQGGVSRFAKLAGLNYANLRQWRSRYLPPDKKRKYSRAVVTVSQLPEAKPEPAPEPEIVDAVVEEVVESEPRVTKLFKWEAETGKLEAEPDVTVEERAFVERRIRTFFDSIMNEQLDLHAIYVTMHYVDGDQTFVNLYHDDQEE